MKKHTALGFAITMALSYPVALNALGLGEIRSNSQLNQPLRAQIDLLSTSAQEAGKLQVRLASPDVFSRVGIDRPPILENLKFTPTMQQGKPVIMVSSDQPLNEPFLNFLLEVSWPQGQLLKEYTVLLDPPVLLEAGKTGSDNAVAVRAEPKSVSGVVERPSQAKAAPSSSSRTQIQVAAPTNNSAQQRAAQDIIAQQAALAAREESSKTSGSTTTSTKKKYRVKRGDTMRKVATKLNERDISTDQMMVALFRANPQAFFDNNINNLKAGSLIVKPARSKLTEVSTTASKRLIRRHYTEWKNYRTNLAKGTQSQKSLKVAASAPATTAPVTKAASTSQANLKVVGSTGNTQDSSNVSASGNATDLAKKLALAQEALASSKSENAELESRVSKLEAIVRKKDRLIQLKNDRLARLEEKLGAENLADETPKPEPVPVPAVGIDPEIELVTQAAKQDEKGDDRVIRNSEPDTEDAGEEKPPTQEEISSAPVKPVVEEGIRVSDPFTPDPELESGILDLLKSPVVAAVGLGSLLTLVLGMLYMRRRSSSHDDADFIAEDEYDTSDDDSVLQEDFATNDSTGASTAADFENADSIDMLSEEAPVASTSDELDAILSEESQDEDEILQEADVYIVYGLHEQAEEELKKAISEKPDKLEYRVKLMENYEAANDSEAFVSTAKGFLNAEGANKQALWDKVVTLGKKIAPESELFTEQNVTTAANLNSPHANDFLSDSPDVDESILEEFNEDLNSDFIDFSNEDVSLEDKVQISGLEKEIDADDFDFSASETDFGLDELSEDIDTKADNILNFDVASSNNKDRNDDIPGVSLDIDTDSGIDKILPSDSTYASNAAEDEDLDNALSFLDLSDDDQEMQEAHIGTKLDLARAYLDMGDVEGARCTLEEVVVEGNEDQKREAEELLQQTG